MAKKYNCTKKGIPYYRLSKTINGVRKEFYGDGKSDAEKKAAEYVAQVEAEAETQAAISSGDVYTHKPLGESLHDWVYTVKLSSAKKASSFSRFEAGYRIQVRSCGMCKKCTLLSTITKNVSRAQIRSCIAKRDASSNTESQNGWFIQVIKNFYEFLRDIEAIDTDNPCRKLKAKKKIKAVDLRGGSIESELEDEDSGGVRAYTKEEKLRIFEVLDADPCRHYREIIKLGFYTGLRQSELIGLKWSDVTWERGIHVNRTFSYAKKFFSETDFEKLQLFQLPKGNRTRFVPLPDSIWPKLRQYHAWQAKHYLSQGLGKPELMFTTSPGNIILPSSLRDKFIRVQQKAGVPVQRFHAIRHTYITDLIITENIPIPVVQQIVGHNDAKTTAAYIHTTNEDLMAAVKLYSAV